MGRRSLTHLSAARNLGHPIEGRWLKWNQTVPKEKSPLVSTLSRVSVDIMKLGLIVEGLTTFYSETRLGGISGHR